MAVGQFLLDLGLPEAYTEVERLCNETGVLYFGDCRPPPPGVLWGKFEFLGPVRLCKISKSHGLTWARFREALMGQLGWSLTGLPRFREALAAQLGESLPGYELLGAVSVTWIPVVIDKDPRNKGRPRVVCYYHLQVPEDQGPESEHWGWVLSWGVNERERVATDRQYEYSDGSELHGFP